MILTASADPFLYENQLVRRGRRGRRDRQEVRRLVPLRGGDRPDQVGLEGGAVVLDLVPGHLQHGPLQEGRVREPPKTWDELLKHGKVLKKQGNPVGIAISHAGGREHHVLVGGVVQRRQGPRGRRQDAGHRLRQDGGGHRVVQGALQGRDGARGPVVGRRVQQPLHPLRQGLLDPQSRSAPTTRPSPTSSPSPTTSTTTTAPAGPAGIHSAAPNLAWASGSSRRTRSSAKEFIEYLFQKQNFDAWIVASNAFNHPPLKNLADHPIWARNPKFAMLPKEAEYAHPRGWPAQAERGRAAHRRTTTSCPTWWPRP